MEITIYRIVFFDIHGNNHNVSSSGGGLNNLREDTMITKWEFGKSVRTHPPPPT